MATQLQMYLGNLGQQLRLDQGSQLEIVRELRCHLEERARELEEAGLAPEAALRQALQELGNPEEIARGMYSVHSTGSWREVVLAILPHLLLASIFALHLWTEMLWVVVGLVGATAVALWAWWAGKPKWSYSWLGYAMAAPAIAWLLALASVGYSTWAFFSRGTLPFGLPLSLGIILYIPFSMWVMVRIARRVVRQDWLLVSLATLPLPFLGSWLFFLRWGGGLLPSDAQPLVIDNDADTALVFVALAITTALFLRIGQRALRIALLVITIPVLLALAILTYHSDAESLPIILATFATAAFLISPVLLESRAVREERWRASFPEDIPTGQELHPRLGRG